MSDPAHREWRFYVADMLSFARNVQRHTEGLSQADFAANAPARDATPRNVELIGDAVTHMPDAIRAAHSSVPWRPVVAMRNRLTHGYLSIDDDTVWSITQDDVPALIVAPEQLQHDEANRGTA